jgi:16S rRNA (cytidine1402-2'-O)-methyltransferase
MPGTLFVVATPIGNLEDITARALRVLREATVIAAEDTRRTAHLLARYGIRTPTVSLHEHNEVRKTAGLIDRLASGDDVALVSDAGTPAISDPGRHLVQAARDAGVPIVPVPGPSAAMAALAVSGFATATFTFLGFPPTRSSDRNDWFDRLRSLSGTVVFFEAPHRIVSTLERVQREVGDKPIVVARELTKAHEELVVGPISHVLGQIKPQGEITVVLYIGQKTNTAHLEEMSDSALATEVGLMTESVGVSRRQAIQRIGLKYGMAPNDVYAAVERAKKSGL